MEVDTTSDKVKKAQDGVLEFLLVNHPLDCPVCDKGGECPLQDQVLAYGPGGEPVPRGEAPLGQAHRDLRAGAARPGALHPVRTVRALRGRDRRRGRRSTSSAAATRSRSTSSRTTPSSSYFSGNTVQICPVGALTSSPYRFTARPWDLDQVESTCTLCAFGCRAAVQSSANRVTRLLGIDCDPLNQSWLCDKGRFGYEAVNADDRIVEPLVRRSEDGAGGDAELVAVSWSEALTEVAERLARHPAPSRGRRRSACSGGARLSNEDAYAWAKLAKGGDRHRLGRRPARRRAPRRGGARPAPGHHRRGLRGVVRGGAGRRPARGAARALPPPAGRRRRRRRARRRAGARARRAQRSFATATLPYRPGEAADASAAALARFGASAPTSVRRRRPGRRHAARARPRRRRRRGGGGRARAAVAGRGRGARGRRPRQRWPRRGPRRAFSPPCGEATSWARSTWASPRGCCPGASASTRGATGTRRRGDRCPSGAGPRRGGDARRPGRRFDGSAVVLVGSDPVGDFPDRALAERGARQRRASWWPWTASSRPRRPWPTSCCRSPSPTSAAGTTTNIEGRVTRLAQKLVAPGQCWPDWMVAAELAERLERRPRRGERRRAVGRDRAPGAVARRGHPCRARHPRGARRRSSPRCAASPVRITTRRAVPPFDPMATPGIDAVEAQGAPPRAGLAEPAGGDGHLGAVATAPGNGARTGAATRPRLSRWPAAGRRRRPCPHPTATRCAWCRPGGSTTTACCSRRAASLAPLAPAATVRANPYELGRLGVATGRAGAGPLGTGRAGARGGRRRGRAARRGLRSASTSARRRRRCRPRAT